MLERESSEEMLEKGVATDRVIPTLQRARDVKGEGPRRRERRGSCQMSTRPNLVSEQAEASVIGPVA